MDAREEAAGVHEQWPAPIARIRPTYEEAQADVELADEEFAKRAARTDKATELPKFYHSVRTKLATARTAIAKCDAFRDPSARLEMLDHLDRLTIQLDAAWRRNAHLAGEASVEPAPVDSDVSMRAVQLVGLLEEYRTAEAQMFARVRALLPVGHGGTNDSWFTASSSKEARELLESPQTSMLYTNWISRIRELRAIYGGIGTPTSAWCVSVTHDETTAHDDSKLDPNLAERIALFMHASRLASNADASSHVVRWRKQASY